MTTTDTDEIDLKEVFRTLRKYKKSIFAITLIFLIFGSVYAYYKPNIYASQSTVEVLSNDKNVNPTDVMMKAFGASNESIDNEQEVIQSRSVIQKALKTLNLQTRYYAYNALGKKTELYKDSPFIVTAENLDDDIYGKKLELLPQTADSFRLVIKPVSLFSLKGILDKLGIKHLKEYEKISYDKVHKYGEKIETPWFTIRVDKIRDMDAKKYSFNFIYPDDLYDTFAGGLKVSVASEYSTIMKLDYSDNVALRAQDILNAITHVYIQNGIDDKTQSAKQTLGFIDSQLDKINSSLTASALKLQNYKMHHRVVNLVSKVELDVDSAAKYQAEQTKLQTEINILANLQRYLRQNKDLRGLTLGTINFADKGLATLVSNLQKLTDEKSLLLVDYTQYHPEVIKLTRSIALTKKAIKQALSSALSQLRQRNRDLKHTIAQYTQTIKALPSQEKQLAELSRPLKVNEDVYKYLLQRKAETAILKSSTIADAKIIDPARVDYFPIKPKRKLIVLVSLILGLIVGIAQAFLRNYFVNTVQNVEEVEHLTSLPVYGVIPLNNNKLSKNVYSEAIRNIRTNLQFLPGHENNKVIAITSSVSGEGKTTLTAALADILAKGNKKVIALDLDMRKASLHKALEVNNNVGMSHYLTGQNTLSEVIKPTGIFGLDIITAGQLPPNPSELILSVEYQNLLRMLRDEYDYIVIDTPPIGLVTDATIIMNYSDISFAVVRAGYTRREFVKNIDRIAHEHSHNRVGIILNCALIGGEYGYGYGANYAYGYGNSQYYQDRG